MKRSLVERGIKSRVGALRKIRAPLMLALDLLTRFWVPISSFCSVKLTQRLMQGFYQAQDSKAIVKNRSLFMIFLNRLADMLDIELLKL